MNISHIPNQPGVYFFKDGRDNILYIGKAKDLNKRVSQYFSIGSVWKQEMISKAKSIDFLISSNESEALYLEDNLIKKHKPYYNNMLKGSNSYAYIKITKEKYPQIFLTRKRINDGGIYIGPKHNTIHLKKFFQYMRQILQYRGCKTSQFKQGKVCSDYYFGLCKGWCDSKIILEQLNTKLKGLQNSKQNSQYNPQQNLNKNNSDLNSNISSPNNLDNIPIISPEEEYQKIIQIIISFFKGDIDSIKNEIKTQIQDAIDIQNFERAAKLRDIFVHLDNFSESQTVVINQEVTGYICKIKQIGDWFVYVLLYFYQGKLIDIVRHKVSSSDIDIYAFVSSLSIDCGEFASTQKGFDMINGQLLIKNKSIKKLSKSDYDDIDIMFEGFFDSYIISTSFEQDNLNNQILDELQKRYNLSKFPYHIECIDISHLGGGWTSGGLSCFVGGFPEKKYYRRYKITTPKSDDYMALKEVVERRFLHSDSSFFPDLLIIDGGKGQLGIIRDLYNSNPKFKEIFPNINFVSIGKGEARKKTKIGYQGKKSTVTEKLYFFDSKLDIHSQDLKYDHVDRILTKLRDEAHRFSNAYREKQMQSEWK